ncbi:MAG: hypothetical protein AAF492_12770 [Verrucomicrobiota bacterium]
MKKIECVGMNEKGRRVLCLELRWVYMAVYLTVIGLIGIFFLPDEDPPPDIYSSEAPYPATYLFKINDLLSKATLLQNLGEEKAFETLKALADKENYRTTKDMSPAEVSLAWFSEFQVYILARMLYEGKEGTPLRPPDLGRPGFLGGTTWPDWPHEPIAFYEGVPILVVDGYLLLGAKQSPLDYLNYCQREGVWTSKKYRTYSFPELRAKLEAFTKTTRWPRQLDPSERYFLKHQI